MLISLLKYLRAGPFAEAFCPNHIIQDRISLLWAISTKHFPCTPPAWERPASKSAGTAEAWNYRLRFASTTCTKLQLCMTLKSVQSSWPDTSTPKVNKPPEGTLRILGLTALLGRALCFLAAQMLSCSSVRNRAFTEAASTAPIASAGRCEGFQLPKSSSLPEWMRTNK